LHNIGTKEEVSFIQQIELIAFMTIEMNRIALENIGKPIHKRAIESQFEPVNGSGSRRRRFARPKEEKDGKN
jgi:hypothetical protein